MTLEIMQLGVAGAALAALTQFMAHLFRFLSGGREQEDQRKAERAQLLELVGELRADRAGLVEVLRSNSEVIRECNVLFHRLMARMEVV